MTVPSTPGDVGRAVDRLVGLIGKRSAETEVERRLPDEVVSALRATGINRLAMPRAMGGLEAPIADMLDVIEPIAAADGSTGWCAAIGMGSNVFAGYLPEAGARTVFADPDQPSATMFAPAGKAVGEDGGHRLTGRWPFASNCLHSTWIGLGALVEGPDGVTEPAPRVVFVPVAQLEIEDTWDVLGLRGTGSHHVSATDLTIDLERTCRFSDRPWPEGTLWRLPIYTVLFPLLVAVPLGIARGAVDEVMRQVREGRMARRGQLADDPVSLAELAEADIRLRSSRAALREAVDEAHQLALRGDRIDRHLQARTYLACLHASDVTVEVTSVAHNLAGASAVYADSSLQRSLRDVETSRQHLLFAHKHRSELAKVLAGLDVTYPPFFT